MTDFVPPLAVSLAMISIASLAWCWLLWSHVRELYRRRAELLGCLP